MLSKRRTKYDMTAQQALSFFYLAFADTNHKLGLHLKDLVCLYAMQVMQKETNTLLHTKLIAARLFEGDKTTAPRLQKLEAMGYICRQPVSKSDLWNVTPLGEEVIRGIDISLSRLLDDNKKLSRWRRAKESFALQYIRGKK